MRTTLIAALALAPTALFAAGSSSSTPPKATKTTTECETRIVYDADKKSCVEIKESALGSDAMFEAARELAYAQLTEIRSRGGRGTWAEISLRMALQNGQGYSY